MVAGSDPQDQNPNKYIYSVDLCSPIPFACDTCTTDSGYCQQSTDKKWTFCVGKYSTASFVGQDGGKGVQIYYTSPPGNDGLVRKGTVTVNCNPNAKTPQNVDIHNPVNVNSYQISFDSAAGCAGGGGLSGGSIFLIILIPGIALYFFGGMLYLGALKGNRGKEMVPNIEFWVTVPGLVQDGITFTITKVKGFMGKT